MNPLALDTVYARRPALTYVSPAICEAVFSSSSFPSLILDAVDPRNRNKVTGLVVTYTGGGDYLINFNNYPGALCYSVYKLNDATDPFSGYVLIAECISDQPFNPDDWVFPKPPPGTSVCYAFTVITADGESDFSDLICVFTPPDPDVPPLPGTGCILNASPLPDGSVDEAYSETLLPNGPADVPQWTIWEGSLPPGLTLNIDSGVISGTPTLAGTFNFVVLLSKNGGGSCTKAFSITITESCSDPLNATFYGQSGLIASGLNVVLPAAEFRVGPPGDGYSDVQVVDGAPRIAVTTVTWGAASSLPWAILASCSTDDGMAYGSISSAFNNNPTKTLRIPVFPYGTNEAVFIADSGSGASGAVMGDCQVSTTFDCSDITELLSVSWDAPIITEAAAGSASGSASGGSFDMEVSNPGGGFDEANVEINGTFSCSGNGVNGKLTLTVSGLNLDSGGDWPRFQITANSDLDGANIWTCAQDSFPEWFGEGVFQVPVCIPCTPGAVITLNVLVETVQGLGENQAVTISGVFSSW